MRAGNPVLRLVVVLAVLGNCLPYFALEDANRDRRVDLSDAVTQVRSLVEAAQNENAEAIDIHKAILAINATAGLETVIAPQPSATQHLTAPPLSSPFCVGANTIPQNKGDGVPCIERRFLFSSMSIDPSVPPPRGFAAAV